MWAGDALYFISDRSNENFNIHRFDIASKEITKITEESVWDIRAADIHGDTIVYEAGGRLKTLDTSSGAITTLSITLTPDLPQLQPSWKNVRGQITAADISNSGKRVAVTARGDVFSVPVDEGDTRNISSSSGVREYDSLWSPDGTQIAYIVEQNRQQILRIEDQSGIGEVRDITLGPDFYRLLDWGGKGQRVVYQNNHLDVFVLEVSTGRSRRIASEARRQFGRSNMTVDTSPDGRWIALAVEQPNFNQDLFLYDTITTRLTRVTDGLADVSEPAFSPDGKLLYFTGSTNAGPTHVGLDMTSQERPYRAGIYVAILEADGKSPLLPKTGDEDGDDNKNDKDEDNDKETKGAAIALEGLDARITALPIAEAAYSDLSVGKDNALYFVQTVQPGVLNTPPGENPQNAAKLMRFDVEKREAKTLMSGVTGLEMSNDGSKLLVSKADGSLLVADAGEKASPEPLDLSGLRLRVDPKAEWAQIFDDVWRMEASYFYDPNIHGLDWDAVYDRYKPLLAHVGRREDLNALMAEMIAEMQAGHNRLGGGDVVREQAPDVGLLGADFALENGRHRIKRLYTGENWNPFLKAPLAEPGLGVNEGDYILAINGRELGAGDNIFEALTGTADTQTVLRISSQANGANARDVTVVPTDTERAIRLWAWVEGNRKTVEKETDGRVGYVYLPNTAGAGYTFFNRMFFSQTDKDALIIDERSNGGGQAANYITDVLSRTYLSGWKDRDGLTFNTPGGAMFGPKLMMIDQDAGSGGDFLPYSFKQMGIGKLLGKRTWGGLIGIAVNPGLVDGGFLTVPYFRYFDTNQKWTIENEGVAPDIDVALDPVAANNGRDTQLERAIEEIKKELATNPSPVPTEAPPYPTELGK